MSTFCNLHAHLSTTFSLASFNFQLAFFNFQLASFNFQLAVFNLCDYVNLRAVEVQNFSSTCPSSATYASVSCQVCQLTGSKLPSLSTYRLLMLLDTIRSGSDKKIGAVKIVRYTSDLAPEDGWARLGTIGTVHLRPYTTCQLNGSSQVDVPTRLEWLYQSRGRVFTLRKDTLEQRDQPPFVQTSLEGRGHVGLL